MLEEEPCLTDAFSRSKWFSDTVIVSELATNSNLVAFVVKDLIPIVGRIIVWDLLGSSS